MKLTQNLHHNKHYIRYFISIFNKNLGVIMEFMARSKTNFFLSVIAELRSVRVTLDVAS